MGSLDVKEWRAICIPFCTRLGGRGFPKALVSRSLVSRVLVAGGKDDAMVAGTMYCVVYPVQTPHEVVDVEIRSQAISCKRIVTELHWASGGYLSHKTWDRYNAILYRSGADQ